MVPVELARCRGANCGETALGGACEHRPLRHVGDASDRQRDVIELPLCEPVTRRADLIQLEQIASGYSSRERFLTELTLDPPDATSDQSGVPRLDEDYLILSTVHSAKGQEWKSVFVALHGCAGPGNCRESG